VTSPAAGPVPLADPHRDWRPASSDSFAPRVRRGARHRSETTRRHATTAAPARAASKPRPDGRRLRYGKSTNSVPPQHDGISRRILAMVAALRARAEKPAIQAAGGCGEATPAGDGMWRRSDGAVASIVASAPGVATSSDDRGGHSRRRHRPTTVDAIGCSGDAGSAAGHPARAVALHRRGRRRASHSASARTAYRPA